MRIGEIAVGRSGDKGGTLDLTLVALDDDGYRVLESRLTEQVAQDAISRVMPGTVPRARSASPQIRDRGRAARRRLRDAACGSSLAKSGDLGSAGLGTGLT